MMMSSVVARKVPVPKAVRPPVLRQAVQAADPRQVMIRETRQRLEAEASIRRLTARVEQDLKLPLQEGTRTRLMLQPDPIGKETVVLLHGWSSGTYQFDEMAPLVFAQGKNVYIPRLEGHGYKTPEGLADPSHMVKPWERDRFHRFAEQVYQDVSGLGPIKLVGLSGGANVALDIAAHHPNVKGVVAMAPYLGSQDRRANSAHDVFATLDRMSFGQASRVLQAIPHDWGKGPIDGPGHWHHTAGGIYALSTYGHQVVNDLKGVQVPIQFITSRADQAASRQQVFRAFDNAGGSRLHGWHDFETVTHAMVSKHNNPDQGSIDVLTRITLDFLESGKRVGSKPTP
jgi:pimeloyl-ACP methyl ester carboxylesterase